MRTATVYCKVCGKKLAFWSMFDNLQYEEEWECLGEFRKKARNVFKSKDGRTCSMFIMDGGAGTKLNPPRPDMKRVKFEMQPCSLYYHTKYCSTCVRKIHFKCVRPRCKGPIRLVRRKNGSATKYTHGGW